MTKTKAAANPSERPTRRALLTSSTREQGAAQDATTPAIAPIARDASTGAHLDALAERDASNPALVYLSRLAPGSRPTQRAALETIARLASNGAIDARAFAWAWLRYEHVQALRVALVDLGYAPATVNRHLDALRGVLREAWRLGLVSAEDYERAIDVRRVRGSRLPAGRALARDELAALFTACVDGTARGARNGAVLALLYAGLRRAEAVSVQLTDYDAAEGAVRVLGKGGRERLVYLATGAPRLLDRWLTMRGLAPGPLLCPVDQRDRPVPRGLTANAVYELCRQLGREIELLPFTPHDLRRTWIGDLLDAGADLSSVQALAGHASPSTTTRYDRRPAETRRRAAELLEVPGG